MHTRIMLAFILTGAALSACGGSEATLEIEASAVPTPFEQPTPTKEVPKGKPPAEEPLPAENMEAQASFCEGVPAQPAQPGSMAPAALEISDPMLSAEWFVAPAGFNMPQEILIDSKGEILVKTVRSAELYRLGRDGGVERLLGGVAGYQAKIDSQDNLYVYDFTAGRIVKITSAFETQTVVESQQLQNSCETGFGLGPDGNFYISYHPCQPVSEGDLIQVSKEGNIRVVGRIPVTVSFHLTSEGRFLSASGSQVFEIVMEDFSTREIGEVPSLAGISPSGITSDGAGNLYLATGARERQGKLFRMTLDGEVSQLATIAGGGLSGIKWDAERGEVIGGQMVTGSVLAVRPDGTVETLVAGNGLLTPMGMAFSPCGELAVANDEAGGMVLIAPDGTLSPFLKYRSWTPPTPFLVFDPAGRLYASEGVNSEPGDVLSVSPESGPAVYVDAETPCGLAYSDRDQRLLIAETLGGRISAFSKREGKQTLVDELSYPQDLAMDLEGNLFVVTGSSDPLDGFWTVPNHGTAITWISPSGERRQLMGLDYLTALAVAPWGELFAATTSQVLRIPQDGPVEVLARGFQDARGLVFDLAGNLYVSDAFQNGILRLFGFPQGAIQGRVVTAAGDPAAGARVQIMRTEPEVAGALVEADSSGRFELLAAPGDYMVRLWQDKGEQRGGEPVSVAAGETVEMVIQE